MASINIFEGSRRIALLIRILWVIGVGFFAYSDSPSVVLRFSTTGPGSPLVRDDYDCVIGKDAMEFLSMTIEDTVAPVNLCFKADQWESRSVIPYKVDQVGTDENGKPTFNTYGNEVYSDQVRSYTKSRAALFTLSEADRADFLAKVREKRWSAIKTYVTVGVVGWFVLWLLQVIAGWVIRGFLGIPQGQDRRPSPPVAPPASP